MFSAKRKVRSNGTTVVGEISSLKRTSVQFESGSEEAFLYILDFDSDVETYHDQPVQIKYSDDQGNERTYTPDYLVEYRDGKKVLFEVKPKRFIEENRKVHARIAKAGRDYCRERSWVYKIITDAEINTQYCDNVRFLFNYQAYPPDLAVSNLVISELEKLVTSTPRELALTLGSSDENVLSFISAIWTLVRNKQIGCDLFQPVNMETPIWPSSSNGINELKFPYRP